MSDGHHQSDKVSYPLHLLRGLLGTSLLFATAFFLLDFPVYRIHLAIALTLYGLLLWRIPSVWLIVLPALIPILDLTPISGRVFFNEFDLFVFTSIGASLLRREHWFNAQILNRKTWLLIFMLVIWQLYTTLNGLLPLPPIDANSTTSYYSQLNALRIAKGFFYALFLLPALGQALQRQDPVAKFFTAGMLASLVLGILVILWERALFTGIFNVSTPYRVTGLFSMMATGGAPIDAHLIMTIPFTYFLLCKKSRLSLIFGGILLLCGLYAVSVTYSRADYPALMLSAAIAGTILFYQNVTFNQKIALYQTSVALKRPAQSHWQKPLALALIFCLLAVVLLSGTYIQQRFTTSLDDLQHRLDHWSLSSRLMDDDILTTVFSMGKGAFPRTYFWQRPDGELPSTTVHSSAEGNHFIIMGKSHSSGDLFLRQRFNVHEPGPYRLNIDLKPGTNQRERLLIEFCERIIFQAYQQCRWLGINTAGDANKWITFNKPINVDGLGGNNPLTSRPVEISILNRGIKQEILIDNVKLLTPSGNQLLKNSEFDQGMDHWFLYSGDHLAWHIKNIWFDAFFEGGAIGLLILITLVFVLMTAAVRRTKGGDQLVIALAAGFGGLLIVGLFDSLFDDPKIGFLFFLSCWILLSNINYPVKVKRADS